MVCFSNVLLYNFEWLEMIFGLEGHEDAKSLIPLLPMKLSPHAIAAPQK